MTTSPATTFLLLPSISRKSLLLVHSSSSPSLPPLKRHRSPRKNYLRPKILKTLPDPFPLDPPFTIPHQIQPDPQPEYPRPDPLADQESKESEFVEASVADVENCVGIGEKVSKFTVFGAFVFYTVCAVWVFGSGQNGVLGGVDETKVLGLNGDGNGVVGVDEDEMKKRVREIQVMAREVREKERRELKISGSKDGVGGDISRIEKEVDRKLGKLGKGVKKKALEYTRNVNVSEDGLVSRDVNGVIFKKSVPESPVVSLSDKKDGVRGLDDCKVSGVRDGSAVLGSAVLEKAGDHIDGMKLLENVQTLDLSNGELVRNDSINSKENEERNTPNSLNGKAMNLKESSSPRSIFDQDASQVVHEDGVLRRDLESDKVGHKASTEGVRITESVCRTDSWWSSLPYVLAVVTNTGGDDEEANKLYTIKNASQSGNDSSYVVAFEDRGDATNFCYLLQSCFEDVHDFSTDIFPIPIKELDEAVKSHFMKVFIVKKGQLQLYAGQPLSDVETTLRSLLKQAKLR